jgi:hypothetical protein
MTKSTKSANKSTKLVPAARLVNGKMDFSHLDVAGLKYLVKRAHTKTMRKAAAAALAARQPAPKKLGLEQRYLAQVTKAHTMAYARSIAKPITAFTTWCGARGIVSLKQVDAKVLARYRRHAEAQGYALSTLRMGLARVQTFLRVSGCKADLSVLRVAHTKAEKRRLAELAETREGEAA